MDFLRGSLYVPMSSRRRVREGASKVLYEGPDPGTLIQHFRDRSCSSGEEGDAVVDEKGVLTNRVSEYIFTHLGMLGVPTYFIRRLNMREQLVRKVEVLPLEVMVRNMADKAAATRFGVQEGLHFACPIVEFYHKNGKTDSLMVANEHIIALGWASSQDVEDMMLLAARMNDFLSGLFLGIGIKLVHFKIEFGHLWEEDTMHVVVANEISPDSCLLWDVRKLRENLWTTGTTSTSDTVHASDSMSITYREAARRLCVTTGGSTLG